MQYFPSALIYVPVKFKNKFWGLIKVRLFIRPNYDIKGKDGRN